MKLSKRELEIALLLKEGAKNRDIALKLEIDQKTVSTYITRIRKKVGLSQDVNTYIIVKEFLAFQKDIERDTADLTFSAIGE